MAYTNDKPLISSLLHGTLDDASLLLGIKNYTLFERKVVISFDVDIVQHAYNPNSGHITYRNTTHYIQYIGKDAVDSITWAVNYTNLQKVKIELLY